MNYDEKCHFLKCKNFCVTNNNRKIICKCCKLSFCSDSCLVEHYILKEKEKNQTSNKQLPEQNNNILSNHIKQGKIIKELDKASNSYFKFSNFQKIVKNSSDLSKKTFHILGNGAFGDVYLVSSKIDNKLYAMKQMNKSKLSTIGIKKEIVKREIQIHSKIIHDNVVRLYSFHEDEENYYMILDYLDCGTLFTIIQKAKGMSEEEAFKYFIQVASAVYFLHENNIIHRDLKPENCLIDKEGNLKICDFGWAVESNSSRKTFCGTYEYMAPEIINELPYTKSIDVWSLGILLYELIHSYSPFRAKQKVNNNNKFDNFDPTVEVIRNILKNKLIIDKKISEECKDLLTKLLNPKMENRLSVAEIFRHPWVKKFEDKLNVTTNLLEVRSTHDLFDSVINNLSKRKKRKSKSFSNMKMNSSLLKTENNKSKQKIVVKIEKNKIEEEKEVNNFHNQVNQNQITSQNINSIEISPIRRNQISLIDESVYSMYKDIRKLDENDRNDFMSTFKLKNENNIQDTKDRSTIQNSNEQFKAQANKKEKNYYEDIFLQSKMRKKIKSKNTLKSQKTKNNIEMKKINNLHFLDGNTNDEIVNQFTNEFFNDTRKNETVVENKRVSMWEKFVGFLGSFKCGN